MKNQCDGCKLGYPRNAQGLHVNNDRKSPFFGRVYSACTKERYKEKEVKKPT